MLDAFGPGHFGYVNQAFDPRFQFDERPIIRQGDHLARESLAQRVAQGRVDPGIGLDLLETQGNALALRVEFKDLDFDLITHVEELAGVIDAAPGHVGDMEQAVDAAEIDEGAVIRQVLDDPIEDLLGGQGGKRRFAHLLALGLEQRAPGENNIAPSLVELDDPEMHPIANHAIEVPHRAKVHLGSRQEGLDSDIHGKAALDPGHDGALY